MELCGVPIRRARAQLIRTVQVGRVPLASRYTRLEFVTRAPRGGALPAE